MPAAASSSRPRPISRRIQEILTKYDILFLDDEIVCGFRAHRQLGFPARRRSAPRRA